MSNVIDFSLRLKQKLDTTLQADCKSLGEMGPEEQNQYLDRLEKRLDAIIRRIEAEVPDAWPKLP